MKVWTQEERKAAEKMVAMHSKRYAGDLRGVYNVTAVDLQCKLNEAVSLLENSIHHIHDEALSQQVWDFLSGVTKKGGK